LKTITLSEFRKLKAEEIKTGPSIEITSDGTPVGVLIVGAVSGMRDRVNGIASQIDAGRGR
jgi:antitoxin (DNA-binding transcriptional repressor) of toxin-antitoxin stability system